MVKNLPAGSIPGFEKIPWRRAWQPTPAFLPGQRSLADYSPWDCKESDMTEQLSTKTYIEQGIQSNDDYFKLRLESHLMYSNLTI